MTAPGSAIDQARDLTDPSSTRPTNRQWRVKPDELLLILFLVPALVYVAVFFAYPIYINVKMSLEQYGFAAVIVGHGPYIGLKNYESALVQGTTVRALVNTAAFTVGSIVFQFGIGFAIAIYFSQHFRGAEMFRRVVLIPWVMPLVAVATVFELVFATPNGLADQVLHTLGLTNGNTPWLTNGTLAVAAIIISNIWVGIPFNAVILYSGLEDVPKELVEAASVDGANRWQRFSKVIVPTMRPVILIVLMLGIVYTVKAFDLVFVLTGGGPANESQLLASWAYTLSLTDFQFGQGAAVGNILLIFCLIVGLIYMRISRDPSDRTGRVR